MKNVPLLVGTLVVTLLLIVGVSYFFSQPVQPRMVDRSVAERDARRAKGPAEAKVTIAEFSDLQCPACRGAQPAVEAVLQKYPNDVRVIYRHYPLRSIHKNADKAAQAAEAAGDLGKFWEMHDLLFSEQDVWEGMSAADFDKKIDEYREKLQIDKTQFQQRIENEEVRNRISDDEADGNVVGVQATPTFFVNGQETTAPQLMTTVESFLK